MLTGKINKEGMLFSGGMRDETEGDKKCYSWDKAAGFEAMAEYYVSSNKLILITARSHRST
ncbi:hypothetical protein [Nitrosospira multiformis]|uniref:hypothetical protein n=1 Tax=Nitrosospira multiformis TaxID=1231 RepID=UPI0003177F26